MTTITAIEVLTEVNRWRRGQGKYQTKQEMPFNPEKLGEAMDVAIKELGKLTSGENQLHPFRIRLIRCIVPNSKCSYPRDIAEDRAWKKVSDWIKEEHVIALEKFYKANKSETADETWKRKLGVCALLNQLREQVDLAETFNSKSKKQFKVASEPKGWRQVAEAISNEPECPQKLRKELVLARSWSSISPHVQSILIERINK